MAFEWTVGGNVAGSALTGQPGNQVSADGGQDLLRALNDLDPSQRQQILQQIKANKGAAPQIQSPQAQTPAATGPVAGGVAAPQGVTNYSGPLPSAVGMGGGAAAGADPSRMVLAQAMRDQVNSLNNPLDNNLPPVAPNPATLGNVGNLVTKRRDFMQTDNPGAFQAMRNQGQTSAMNSQAELDKARTAALQAQQAHHAALHQGDKVKGDEYGAHSYLAGAVDDTDPKALMGQQNELGDKFQTETNPARKAMINSLMVANQQKQNAAGGAYNPQPGAAQPSAPTGTPTSDSSSRGVAGGQAGPSSATVQVGPNGQVFDLSTPAGKQALDALMNSRFA